MRILVLGLERCDLLEAKGTHPCEARAGCEVACAATAHHVACCLPGPVADVEVGAVRQEELDDLGRVVLNCMSGCGEQKQQKGQGGAGRELGKAGPRQTP